MKSTSKFNSGINLAVAVILLATMDGCQNEEMIPISTELVRFDGQTTNMNGEWLSGCVDTGNGILSESFNFQDDQLIIMINGYDNANCNGSPNMTETIEISFSVNGTFTTTFDDMSVQVNQIDGQATYGDGRSESFKQSFLIVSNNNSFELYHARFGDDGGQVNAAGYPVDMIPIPIVKY